jgi:hypothetical protein
MPQLLAVAGAALIGAITAGATAGAAAGAALGAGIGLAGVGAAIGGTVGVIGGALVGIGAAVGAVGAAIGGAGAAFTLGTTTVTWGTVAKLVGTVALLGVSMLLKPRVGIGAAGSQTDFQADPTAGIPLTLGRTGVAGKAVHMNTSGQADKNKALMYLLALSAGPIQGVESMKAGDFAVALSGEQVTSPPQYAGKMFLRYSYGLKPEPTAIWPAGVGASVLPEWTSACKTSGVACAWWTLIYDSTAYPSGVPKPLFVVLGPAVYDPRKDSTVPGGSGSQRWNDETSWSFTGNTNPFLQGLTWCIGRRDNGVLSFGIGANIAAIDVPAFIQGANVCEANGWTVGGEVLSSDRKWDVLTTILQAGGGEPIKLAGMISCYVRTPRVSIATVTGRDCIADVSITGSKSRRNRLNQIIPSYRSEANGWTLVPAGAVTVSTYLAADGELRSKEGSYPLVQSAAQVAQLAAYDIVDAREFEPVVLPLGPALHALKPGDCITANDPEFGMSNQQLLIETRELDPTTGRIVFTCRSETPGKDAYALGQTPNPPPISSLAPINPAYVSQPGVGSWTATGGVLTGPDGAQVPAIIITGAIDDPNVMGVIVDYALQLSPGSFGPTATVEAPGTAHRIELRALVSGGTYHVMIRYRNVRGVEGSLALDLGLVTAGTLISQGVTQIGGQTPEELVQQLNDTTALGQQTSDQAAQTAQDLLVTNQNLYDQTHLSDGTPLETYAVNGITKAQTDATYAVTRVDAIGVLQPDGHSFQLSDATLYAAPGQTWGQYKTSTQSAINNNTAAITTESNTRASADSALSTQISNVSTTVDGHTSSITNLQSSVNGLNAQWVLSVSSTGPGYARIAGVKVAANPSVSSMAFVADQIGFTDGSSNVYPLAVTGGKVIATNFQADDIKANTITTNKIVANNISQTTQVNNSGAISVTTSITQILTTTINCSGGYVNIDVWGNANCSGSDDTWEVDLKIDGAAASEWGTKTFNGATYNQVIGHWRFKPSPGNHVFSLSTFKYGSATVTISDIYMTITDEKTQA